MKNQAPNGLFLLTSESPFVGLDSNNNPKPREVRIFLDEIVSITTHACQKNYLRFETIYGEYFLKISLKRFLLSYEMTFVQIGSNRAVNQSKIVGRNGNANVYVGKIDDYTWYPVSRAFQTEVARKLECK